MLANFPGSTKIGRKVSCDEEKRRLRTIDKVGKDLLNVHNVAIGETAQLGNNIFEKHTM